MDPAPEPYARDGRQQVRRIASFVANHPRCMDRYYPAGHLTASGFVVDPTTERTLLILHRKLDKWLQPGGHLEAGELPPAAASREVAEETGLVARRVSDVPFDADVHVIPGREGEPGHAHFDLRYLFFADSTAAAGSEEVAGAEWISFDRITQYTDEPSILRMAVRTERLLAGGRRRVDGSPSPKFLVAPIAPRYRPKPWL